MHEPSTLEVIICLSHEHGYCKLLLQYRPDRSYVKLLALLIDKDFYRDEPGKTMIKKIAADFGCDSGKIAKWLREAFSDIFELNIGKPELFQKEGIKVTLYLMWYDNACRFHTSLPVLPRQYEMVNMFFLRAKFGLEYFWVKEVVHGIEAGSVEISLMLEGGFVNKYRELMVDKALFRRDMTSYEMDSKTDHEVDTELRKLYRHS